MLNDLYEPKITGFGPDPDMAQDGDATEVEFRKYFKKMLFVVEIFIFGNDKIIFNNYSRRVRFFSFFSR